MKAMGRRTVSGRPRLRAYSATSSLASQAATPVPGVPRAGRAVDQMGHAGLGCRVHHRLTLGDLTLLTADHGVLDTEDTVAARTGSSHRIGVGHVGPNHFHTESGEPPRRVRIR